MSFLKEILFLLSLNIVFSPWVSQREITSSTYSTAFSTCQFSPFPYRLIKSAIKSSVRLKYFSAIFTFSVRSGSDQESTHLDRRKRHLFGQEINLMTISKLNHALQTHSTKKNASWALVWALSNVQAEVLKDVRTVMFRMTGTRISGWVLRQNDTIDTTMKNTEMIPIT